MFVSAMLFRFVATVIKSACTGAVATLLGRWPAQTPHMFDVTLMLIGSTLFGEVASSPGVVRRARECQVGVDYRPFLSKFLHDIYRGFPRLQLLALTFAQSWRLTFVKVIK